MNQKQHLKARIRGIIVLVQALLILLLLLMIGESPRHLVYDEANTVPTIVSFRSHGLSHGYLNSLTHASGPLWGVVYTPLLAKTGDDPHGLRFANGLLLCLLAGLLAWLLQREHCPDSLPLAGSLIAIPTIWVCGGLALDEALGLLFLSLALVPLGTKVFVSDMPYHEHTLRFLLAGIAIGLASLVRQPFILAALAIPAAAILHRCRLVFTFITGLAALAILSPVLLIWRGLTPPLLSRHSGIAPEHGLLGFAYGGLFFILVAPGYFRFRSKWIVGAVITSIALNTLMRVIVFKPAFTLASRILPPAIESAYGIVCGALLLAAGTLCAAGVLVRMVKLRHEPWQLTIHTVLFFLLAWPVVMKVQFSSRYTLMALPLIILAASNEYCADWITLGRTVTGGLLGAGVLLTYYRSV